MLQQLGKVKNLVLLISILNSGILFSQSEKEYTKIDFTMLPLEIKPSFFNDFTDGITYEYESKRYYFFIYFSNPQCCQNDISFIEFTQCVHQNDSMISYFDDVILIDSINDIKYLTNSLRLVDIEKDNKPEILFFYTIVNRIGGLDPLGLHMVVIHDNEYFTFKGRIPLHQDFQWEKVYSVIPDKKLEIISPTVFNYSTSIWNEFVERYRLRFQSCD